MREHISNIDTVNSPSYCVDMNVVPNEYASSDSKIALVINNNCSFSVTYSNDYTLEFYNAQKNQWENIVYKDINIVFDLIAIELNGHSSDTMAIFLYPQYHKFIPGKYKVRKNITVENEKLDLEAEFFIKDEVK